MQSNVCRKGGQVGLEIIPRGCLSPDRGFTRQTRKPKMGDNAEKPAIKATADTPDVLSRPDFHFEGQIGRTYLASDPAQFPQPVTAPKGAAAAFPPRLWIISLRKDFATIISIRPRFAARPAPR
jgi:hypothetical protein